MNGSPIKKSRGNDNSTNNIANSSDATKPSQVINASLRLSSAKKKNDEVIMAAKVAQ